jgi:hypothetical protein
MKSFSYKQPKGSIYTISEEYRPYIKYAYIPGMINANEKNVTETIYASLGGFNDERTLNCVASEYGGTGIRVSNFPVYYSPYTVIARIRNWSTSTGTNYPGTLINGYATDIGLGWNVSTGVLSMQYGGTISSDNSGKSITQNNKKATNISYQFYSTVIEQYGIDGILNKNTLPFDYSVGFTSTVDIGWMSGQSSKTVELLGLVVSNKIIPDKLVEKATGENFYSMFKPVTERKLWLQLSSQSSEPPVVSTANDPFFFGGGF